MDYNGDRTLMKPSDFDWQQPGVRIELKCRKGRKDRLSLLITRLHKDWLSFFPLAR
ncbi:hypothetical protein DAPPUDRAFT_305980 [Daphnia pulex]|uniref:Uncharacterized protein n=1 Tax=Daphnia pulex TaxID=6669 RepID=E9GU62_DAPPU|nr:hypothetical protein DAPPUDRAFT_305980 [Daphnia pulex]|eukprot:EFX77029.1 hypothetical protein DAPPUDRAFT_305980 [Daphnia pulex]